MKKNVAVFLVFSLLCLSGSVLAEKKGADVIIQKIDGQQVQGELITVKKDSLLVMEKKSGADVSVGIRDITHVKIVRKSKAGKGALYGLLVGGALGGILYASSDKSKAFSGPPEAIAGAAIGAIGLTIGTLFGIAAGSDKTFVISRTSNAANEATLDRLRKKARISNFQ